MLGKLRGLHHNTAFGALPWPGPWLSTRFSPLLAGGCACTVQPNANPNYTRTKNRIGNRLALPYAWET